MALPLLGLLGRTLVSNTVRASAAGKTKSIVKGVSKVFGGGKDTKKISKEKLLGKDGGKGGALVKVGKSPIKINKSGALVKTKKDVTAIQKFVSGDTQKENKDKKNVVIESKKLDFTDIINEIQSIKQTLAKLKYYAEQQLFNDLNYVKESRKQKEISRKRSREEELEKPKSLKIAGVSLPSAPQMGFLDRIINFFTMVLIGSLLNFLLSKKKVIFAALEDIKKGFDNIWNVTKFALISLSNTAKGLIRAVGKLSAKVFKGPAILTKNLLSKLGNKLSGLFKRAGSFVTNFIKDRIKNVTNAIGRGGATAGATRATGTRKRQDTGKGSGTKPSASSRGGGGTPRPVQNSTVKRAEKLFGEKGAKHLGKVSKVFKKIPVIGALIGIGIDLAMGERLDNAIAGAAGATLGAAIGGAIGTVALPIPGIGSFLGGMIGAAVGDWIGKEIYRNISGQLSQINPKQEDLGPLESPGSTPGSRGGGQFTGSAADIPPEGKALLDAIAGAEAGGYNARYPSKTFDNGYKDHPRIRERTPWGTYSDAAGRYQFMSPTWDKYKPAKEFTPENQDIAAWRLATAVYGFGESGIVRDLKKDPMIVAAKLRGTWPSLPGGSQQNTHTQGFLTRYKNSVKKYSDPGYQPSSNVLGADKSGTVGPTPGSIQGGPGYFRPLPGGSFKGGSGQVFGASRDGGRRHAGVDITESNWKPGSDPRIPVVAIKGGIVLKEKYVPGTQYLSGCMIKQDDGYDVRYLHMTPSVRPGQRVSAGQQIGRLVDLGNQTHLHVELYESSTKKLLDPTSYIKAVEKGASPGRIAQPAQRPSASVDTLMQREERVRQLQARAAYEGGDQVVPMFMPIGPSGGTQILPGPNAGGMMVPMIPSHNKLLNSYYQKQLIGFLYKQG